MKLKYLLEQLPPQEGEKDLRIKAVVELFHPPSGTSLGKITFGLEIDRITILGDVVITLVEK